MRSLTTSVKRPTLARESPAVREASPIAAQPAATPKSVAVGTLPPKTSPSSASRNPTLCGPTAPPSPDTRLPPPSAMDSRSGIRKSVRTPPTSTSRGASRGNPARR